MSQSLKYVGASTIALAIGFNVPYAILVSSFDYPNILRQPADVVLARFADGGAELILTWYAFGLTALALAPLSLALSLTPENLTHAPNRAIGAGVLGALAAVAQAIGLFRWTFVIPGLAAKVADPQITQATRTAALEMFTMLNQFAGVAIGEHVGQLLTAAFVATLSSAQASAGRFITALTGAAAAIAIGVGTGEGLAHSLGANGKTFSLATIVGYLGLSVWLLSTGVNLLRDGTPRRARS